MHQLLEYATPTHFQGGFPFFLPLLSLFKKKQQFFLFSICILLKLTVLFAIDV